MNTKQLIQFEKDIAQLYETGKIHYPIHLAGGKKYSQEKNLIKIFKKINKNDWIFGTWRNHMLWLLSGRSPEKLKYQILNYGSMHIYDDRFFTSAIVGGIAPIAVGVAWALKKKKSKNRVWVFVGDMAASGGLFHECVQYAMGHDLPIVFVIENNELSVKTKTKSVWGKRKKNKVIKYNYTRKYNHAGCALNGQKKWVLF